MITADRDYVIGKYNLKKLKDLENLVARAVEVNIPFNNPITGFCAFTHVSSLFLIYGFFSILIFAPQL
jgi:homocitrate synthase